MKKSIFVWILLILVSFGLVTLGAKDTNQRIKVALDWTPNTNHTGLYVAKKLGFFDQQGLEVDIVQPGPAGARQLVATGKTEFGIDHQEYVTMSRTNQDIPVVSIATIIQHNTSGFASLEKKGIDDIEDFEGKRYGGWSSELEEKVVQSVMKLEGADFKSVTFVNKGTVDFPTAARQNMADFFWIFYGWDGINAIIQGLEFNYIPLIEISEVFDYYTPIIITSESMIDKNPELAKRFLQATSKGYEYAINNPQQAAEILLEYVPELDEELVKKSQNYLSKKYAEDTDVWGIQKREVWSRFSEWMYENGLIDEMMDVDKAFTNESLPTGGVDGNSDS